MAERRKSASRKSTVRKTARKAGPKRWSQRVARESDALDLKRGVFKLTSAKKIATSLKRSAEHSSAAQDRRLSLGAVDADLLYQPRQQEFAEDRACAARAREGGIEASVWSKITDVVPGKRSATRDPLPQAAIVARDETCHVAKTASWGNGSPLSRGRLRGLGGD